MTDTKVSDPQFHADQVDQMDLALDQLALKDRNYDRFALLLIDNVVELALHRYAQSKSTRPARPRPEDPPPRKDVQEALGRGFDKKVALAKKEGLLTEEEAESINYLHDFRNKAHHAGVRHEGILHSLAVFYFKLASSVMERLAAGKGFWWWEDTALSLRAKKYLGSKSAHDEGERAQQAWRRFVEIAGSMEDTLVADLHNALNGMVDVADGDIRFIAENSPRYENGGWKHLSRKEAILQMQLSKIWMTEEARAFLVERFAGRKDATMAEITNCLKDHWDWPLKDDPVPGWRRNLQSLAGEKSNHAALKKYCEFVERTEDVIEEISVMSGDVDEGIERAAEEAREEGRL